MTKILSVLTVAGSDSGGGAGIQADLKTFAALGLHGLSALTAVTAQNTVSVDSVLPISLEMVKAQMSTLFCDFEIKAIKTGMLFDIDLANAVAQHLQECTNDNVKVVCDPVMVATSGDSLVHGDYAPSLWHNMIPQSDIITPNVAEAAKLLSSQHLPKSEYDVAQMAKELCARGAKAAVITGGNSPLGEFAIDILCVDSKIYTFKKPWVSGFAVHGAGCTFSSAIASYLAYGQGISTAVENATKYIEKTIKKACQVSVSDKSRPLFHLVELL